MNRDLGDERREFGLNKMEITDLPDDPIELFSDLARSGPSVR